METENLKVMTLNMGQRKEEKENDQQTEKLQPFLKTGNGDSNSGTTGSNRYKSVKMVFKHFLFLFDVS